jgi:hypothetical protein
MDIISFTLFNQTYLKTDVKVTVYHQNCRQLTKGPTLSSCIWLQCFHCTGRGYTFAICTNGLRAIKEAMVAHTSVHVQWWHQVPTICSKWQYIPTYFQYFGFLLNKSPSTNSLPASSVQPWYIMKMMMLLIETPLASSFSYWVKKAS